MLQEAAPAACSGPHPASSTHSYPVLRPPLPAPRKAPPQLPSQHRAVSLSSWVPPHPFGLHLALLGVTLMCRLWGSSLSQRCPNKVWVQMGPFVGSTIRSQMPRPQNLPEPVPEAGGTGQAWSPGGAPCKCIGFQAPFALLTVAEGKVGGMGWGQGWPG